MKTQISALIVAAAFASFGLSAQASVAPATASAKDAATIVAMGASTDWCAPKHAGTDASGKAGACEKVAMRSAW